MIIEGRDVIAVPMTYYDEFRRDPIDSLLKYGSMPQRARAPWFTDVEIIKRSLYLPSQVTGPRSEEQILKNAREDEAPNYRALVAAPDELALLDGISSTFADATGSYWHAHVDLALNKKRHGDAAGIAVGRISGEWEEVATDPLLGKYRRVVKSYEIPLVAQILAPMGGQVYIGGITRFILQLKYGRGLNITSFSFDGFESADQMHQLAMAGLVTHGMHIDQVTGIIQGLPKPFSVDRQVAPYRELLEGMNEQRVALANYPLLRRELSQLEIVEPGKPPDHPLDGSKDVADPCAGVVGYLAQYGHAVLQMPGVELLEREDHERALGEPLPATHFGVSGGDSGMPSRDDVLAAAVDVYWEMDDEWQGFGVE